MDIYSIFSLECARSLPLLPDAHPCARVHGHSFRIEVHVTGPLDERLGWVLDFADLERAWAPVHATLDHRYLNDVPGLENPTSEVMAIWIWEKLKPAIPGLSKVIVQETARSGCIYSGN